MTENRTLEHEGRLVPAYSKNVREIPSGGSQVEATQNTEAIEAICASLNICEF
jgi:hypothetical protein